MEIVHVVCALIERPGGLLVARRAPGQRLAGQWEFPGGKVEAGETAEAALRREIREELGTELQLLGRVGLSTVETDGRLICLEGLRAQLVQPLGRLSVHDQVQWLDPWALASIDLAAADRPLGQAYCQTVLPPRYPDILDTIGQTPLIRLRSLGSGRNQILLKLEGNNPAGSVKDRPAVSMIRRAQDRGQIRPGDTLIEATSGNTGIALAMAAAVLGYKMLLIMPENSSLERRQAMSAYGAQVILTPQAGGMEASIDLARQLEASGQGRILDQFANPDNPLAHFETTGPELWQQTRGSLTHFVASTGTTGTLMGVGRYLKTQNPAIQIVGAVPAEGAAIPGIRRWPEAYLPAIYQPERLDQTLAVPQAEAEATTRLAAEREGVLMGISSGGNLWTALQLDAQLTGATIVAMVCDRGDRYFSTGVFAGGT